MSLETFNKIVAGIEDVLKLVDLFHPSHPGNMVFQKLEEAILWTNVLSKNIPLKDVDAPAHVNSVVPVADKSTETTDTV